MENATLTGSQGLCFRSVLALRGSKPIAEEIRQPTFSDFGPKTADHCPFVRNAG